MPRHIPSITKNHYARSKYPWFAGGIFALLLVLFSGSDVSCDRYAFTIVSFAQAAGMFLSKYSRWAIPFLAYSAIVLITFAIRFSRNIWVA